MSANKHIADASRTIFGLDKFYTNEFDAFRKYYTRINDDGNEGSSFNFFIQNVHHMREGEPCTVVDLPDRDPKVHMQNLNPAIIQEESKTVKYAHASIDLKVTSERGKHLIARQFLPTGTIVVSEPATILDIETSCLCVNPENRIYRCHHCANAMHKFYTCQCCQTAIYCSSHCLTTASSDYHQYECEGLQRHYWGGNNRVDYSYLAFRMVIYGARKKFGCTFEDGTIQWGSAKNNFPYINRLESRFHLMPIRKVYEILWKATRTVAYLRECTEFFSDFGENMENMNIDEMSIIVGGFFVQMYCQAQINAIQLDYPDLTQGCGINVISSKGRGIFPSVALLNHSCTPNSVLIPCQNYVLVKTIRPLQPGEEVTISYYEIDDFNTLDDRRLMMTDYFYFNTVCKCKLCYFEGTYEDYPYKCMDCDQGTAKPVQLTRSVDLLCKLCKKQLPINEEAATLRDLYEKKYHETFQIYPLINLVPHYLELYPANSYRLLNLYCLIYEKYSLWGEKPIESMHYLMQYFRVMEKHRNLLQPKLLEIRLKCMGAILYSAQLMKLDTLSDHERTTVELFEADFRMAKNQLNFYLPDEYVQRILKQVADKMAQFCDKFKLNPKKETNHSST